MDLVPFIFHETQEAGSQLCAQHCLNNLLQQHMYSEFDLADIARKLDQQENAAKYRAPEAKSYNYDDTGFFSISVLEKAMQVWDLTLVRWRGEAMRPFQDKPEEQSGFILNLASHWFTLRRFGYSTRWYNLNSFLPEPQWISPTYLDMVLKQAEAEGYSVFVVRQAGPGAGEEAVEDPGEGKGWQDSGVGVMPESAADAMALELGEVKRRGGFVSAQEMATSVAGPSRSQTTDQDDLPAAGSGRRRRRQEDLVSDQVEEQDLLPGSGSAGGRTPQPSRSYLPRTGLDDDDEELDDEAEYLAAQAEPTDFQYANRSYDDEDEALQAALRASMEDAPPDYVMPELPPKNPVPVPRAARRQTPPAAMPAPEPDAAAPTPATPAKSTNTVDDDDNDEPARELSADEIRRARLARFNDVSRPPPSADL